MSRTKDFLMDWLYSISYEERVKYYIEECGLTVEEAEENANLFDYELRIKKGELYSCHQS